MMKCTSFHYSLLLRTLKYIEKTLFYGILYKINRNDSNLNFNKPLCELTMYSDSYWEVYTKTRKSISGWASFLEGCIIIWVYRGQNTISQRRTEAEIVAQNEAVRNVLFIKYIIEFLYINIESKITLFCDNNGETF